MKKQYVFLFIGLSMLISCALKQRGIEKSRNQETLLINQIKNDSMKLGAFSISLNVKDIKVSKLFYENLGFSVLAGDLKKNYLIMKNGHSLIGLFQGMFNDNIITFNPGWDENGKEVNPFDDVREIQQELKDKGIKLDSEIKDNPSGPASVILKDPDGNVIFIDQHR